MLTPMLSALTAYYRDQGILSTAFTCPHQDECKGDCASFTGPKSTFVPMGYERHDRPRLLILSSDSGGGGVEEEGRLPEAVRRQHEEPYRPEKRGRHWYRTHELAWYILWRLDPDHALQIYDVNQFFAHTNAAKCSENNRGNRQAKDVLFVNCRPYIRAELEILCPDILVTQGDKARDAVGLFETARIDTLDSPSHLLKWEESDRPWLEQYGSDRYVQEITNLTEKGVFWLHTAHPTRRGKGKSEFLGQIDLDKSVPLDYYRDGEPRRCRGYRRYASIIHAWWNTTRGPWKISPSND